MVRWASMPRDSRRASISAFSHSIHGCGRAFGATVSWCCLTGNVQIIKDGRENKTKNVIKEFGEIQILNGRYGPYIKKGKDNYRIPKGTDPATLDQAACEQIMEEQGPTRRRGRRGASTS